MSLTIFRYKYAFDKGLNLLQRTGASAQTRMIVASRSNRAINSEFYSSLDLSTAQEDSLNQTFIDGNIFDQGGNQLKSAVSSGLGWDYRSMLVNTATDRKNDDGAKIGQLNEYNLYAKTGKRNRKITEKTNASGNITEIQEALYLGNLEYRSTWIGSNLSYDGEIVSENGESKTPEEAYVALRIRQGHKTVSEKRVYTFKGGSLVSETASFFSLDNNINSCELQLNSDGNLESYYSSKPYGEKAVSYGKVKLHPYKYSGQEKDQSGLYYYGYRSLLPQNFRWMSPDPAGVEGSGLNWYAMVNGNPITMRDIYGLEPNYDNRNRRDVALFLILAAVAFTLVGYADNSNSAPFDDGNVKASSIIVGVLFGLYSLYSAAVLGVYPDESTFVNRTTTKNRLSIEKGRNFPGGAVGKKWIEDVGNAHELMKTILPMAIERIKDYQSDENTALVNSDTHIQRDLSDAFGNDFDDYLNRVLRVYGAMQEVAGRSSGMPFPFYLLETSRSPRYILSPRVGHKEKTTYGITYTNRGKIGINTAKHTSEYMEARSDSSGNEFRDLLFTMIHEMAHYGGRIAGHTARTVKSNQIQKNYLTANLFKTKYGGGLKVSSTSGSEVRVSQEQDSSKLARNPDSYALFAMRTALRSDSPPESLIGQDHPETP